MLENEVLLICHQIKILTLVFFNLSGEEPEYAPLSTGPGAAADVKPHSDEAVNISRQYTWFLAFVGDLILKNLNLEFPNISAITYEEHLLEGVWSSHIRVASIPCYSDNKGEDCNAKLQIKMVIKMSDASNSSFLPSHY